MIPNEKKNEIKANLKKTETNFYEVNKASFGFKMFVFRCKAAKIKF